MVKNLIYLYIIFSIPHFYCQEPKDSLVSAPSPDSLNSSRTSFKTHRLVLPPVIFAKATGSLLFKDYREDYFGKFFHCHNKDYFADVRRTNLKNSNYLKCGIFFNKFEKYCSKNLISYNKKELRHYRYMSVMWNVTMGLIAPTFVLIFLDATRYANRTGYARLPNAFFRGDYALVLWPAVGLEYVVGTAIRSQAEKRLKEKLFIIAL